MQRVFLIVLISVFSNIIFAKYEFRVYPTLGYSDATEFYTGALAYLRYRPQNVDESIPKNFFYLSSIYSQKKQFSIQFQPTIYLKNGKNIVSSEFKYEYWPSSFYGIGNDSTLDQKEEYTPQWFLLRTELYRRLGEKYKVSLFYQFDKYQISKYEPGGVLESKSIPGSEENLLSAFGFKVIYDTKNSTTFPTSGSQYCFTFAAYSEYFGSDYNFLQYQIDLRKYLPISPSQTIAIQTYSSVTHEEAPFYKYPELDDKMRAITSNMFVDKKMLVFRMEDRVFPWSGFLKEELGFVGFAEVGRVWDSDFSLDGIKFNYGVGLRYSFFMNDRVNLRFDIAFGEVMGNISMGTQEVF